LSGIGEKTAKKILDSVKQYLEKNKDKWLILLV
jgi:Holliday junction resolvasome RuvABC DNA-binding subunit